MLRSRQFARAISLAVAPDVTESELIVSPGCTPWTAQPAGTLLQSAESKTTTAATVAVGVASSPGVGDGAGVWEGVTVGADVGSGAVGGIGV
jgi:hypothetical protein